MINGDRVKQAREFRGWKQAELAERIGVSQSFVAQLETGFARPSEETITALARETGFPTGFFRQGPPADFPLGSLLYRARVAATASEKWKAYRHAQLLFELALKMQHHLSELPVKVPRLQGTPADPVHPRDAARLTRDKLGLPPDTPIDSLIRRLEGAGVLVLAIPVQLLGIDAFAGWVGMEGPRPVIVLSAGAPGDRLRWSAAHEFAHLVLHFAPEGTPATIEKEADQFAAEFLLPEVAIRRELITPLTLTDVARLKLRWGVSIQALIRRAYDLAIITDRQYRSLFEQLSAYGWRKKEPSNLDIPVEKPRALHEMAEVLFRQPNQNDIDIERLAKTMLLPVDDTREMLAAFASKTNAQHGDGSAPRSGNVVPFASRERQRGGSGGQTVNTE